MCEGVQKIPTCRTADVVPMARNGRQCQRPRPLCLAHAAAMATATLFRRMGEPLHVVRRAKNLKMVNVEYSTGDVCRQLLPLPRQQHPLHHRVSHLMAVERAHQRMGDYIYPHRYASVFLHAYLFRTLKLDANAKYVPRRSRQSSVSCVG